jgi:hypothetical protein
LTTPLESKGGTSRYDQRSHALSAETVLRSPALYLNAFGGERSSHDYTDIVRLLAYHNLRHGTFPAHATDFFHGLDVVTFGLLKRDHWRVKLDLPDGSPICRILAILQV